MIFFIPDTATFADCLSLSNAHQITDGKSDYIIVLWNMYCVEKHVPVGDLETRKIVESQKWEYHLYV